MKKRLSNDALIRDEQVAHEQEQPSRLGRWAKLGILATGTALGLSQLGGVAVAAGPDDGAADRLALNAAGLHGDDLALLAAPAAPAIGELGLKAGPNDARSSKSNGNGNNGNNGGGNNGNGHGSQSAKSAPNGNNGNNVASAKTHQTSGSPANGTTTVKSPKSPPTSQTASPGTVTGVTTVKTPGTPGSPGTANGGDNGLHLGQQFHQGVNDQQAQAILNAMGGNGGGLTTDDIKAMSLGELLQTAHAAGLTTEQVADLLEQHQE